MQIHWLARALQNLDDEANYIAKENPSAAANFVSQIQRSLELLQENPSMGRPGRVNGTRELIIAGMPYIIPYRVRPHLKRIEVLRVFHSSRRPPVKW